MMEWKSNKWRSKKATNDEVSGMAERTPGRTWKDPFRSLKLNPLVTTRVIRLPADPVCWPCFVSKIGANPVLCSVPFVSGRPPQSLQRCPVLHITHTPCHLWPRGWSVHTLADPHKLSALFNSVSRPRILLPFALTGPPRLRRAEDRRSDNTRTGV